jgi:hypothetical protein
VSRPGDRPNESDVTREGLRGPLRSARDAMTGVATGRAEPRRGRDRRGEQAMVPSAEFGSYYGRPVLNPPTWQAHDIAGYLFLGGLAGASSLLGAGAQETGRPGLSKVSKLGAIGAITLSLVALVDDLGRPLRFLNMLRVVKPTSPMSLGTWLLSGYAPLAGIAAASDVTGRAPRIGAAATAGAAILGPAVASYTAVLFSDTAVPAWHEGYREMPFVFVGSAAAAAGGLGLLAAPTGQTGPARMFALLGVGMELGAFELMRRRIGMIAEAYSTGTAGRLIRASKILALVGAGTALLGRHRRLAGALSGVALLGASAATRFGVFHAGVASAEDPKYTVVPQRERLRRRERQVPQAR